MAHKMGGWYVRRAKTSVQTAREAASAMKQMQVVAALFIKGCEADHQLGRSIHPFDVVSWAKEGNDEELENTLKVIAEVANVEVKDLVKDLLCTRPYMLKEMEAGNDLVESWRKTCRVFKDRLVAIPRTLLAVICIWRGTGALEAWFHIGKPQNCKKRLEDDQGTARMRIRINGPSVEEFCGKRLVGGKVRYEPGELCLLAQSLYATDHGTMGICYCQAQTPDVSWMTKLFA